MNDSGIYDDGQMSREASVTRMPSEPKSNLRSINKESGMVGSKLATPRSRLPVPESRRQPSLTQITRKSEAAIPNNAVSNIQQPFQRERSIVETNIVETPNTSNITQILPAMGSGEGSASTPGPGSGGKSSANGSPTLTQVILSDKMEEKITNKQLKRRKIGGMNNMKRRKSEEVHNDHNYVTRSR